MLDIFEPTRSELVRLARREASIEHEPAFRPICLGRWGNLAVLLLIGVAALPFVLVRALGALLGLRPG